LESIVIEGNLIRKACQFTPILQKTGWWPPVQILTRPGVAPGKAPAGPSPARSKRGLNPPQRIVDIRPRHAYDSPRIAGAKPVFAMSANHSDPYNATVVGREEINPQLVILRVRPAGELFDFKPGQFAVLGMLGQAPRVE
jgi:hypothetical protein